MSESDKKLYEGNIFYDIRFSASTKDAHSNLIINIEEQNDYYPGYPILKRAAYYCGRMISAQNGTIFSGQDYGKLRKVVSIWICPNPPKKRENSIIRFSTQEEAIIGMGDYKKSEYDMTNVVIINLGSPSRESNDVLRLLSVLLSTSVEPQDKKQILENGFKIPMTVEITEEVTAMCNLSDGIEKRGIEKGKSEVIVELLNANQSLEFISKVTKFSKEKIAEIAFKNGIALV
ncbi:MAG: hypothetical protein IKN12_00075 [Selenomonadaceae bacterium]|nr:hypothetical protein [Selenomonadaceae bacterium]